MSKTEEKDDNKHDFLGRGGKSWIFHGERELVEEIFYNI